MSKRVAIVAVSTPVDVAPCSAMAQSTKSDASPKTVKLPSASPVINALAVLTIAAQQQITNKTLNLFIFYTSLPFLNGPHFCSSQCIPVNKYEPYNITTLFIVTTPTTGYNLSFAGRYIQATVGSSKLNRTDPHGSPEHPTGRKYHPPDSGYKSHYSRLSYSDPWCRTR